MISGIHHIAIATPDIDRALGFYRDLLGFEVKVKGEWERGNELADRIVGLDDSEAKAAMLAAGNVFIELQEYSNPTPRTADPSRRPCDHSLTHICLNVTDIDAEYDRLLAAGVEFNNSPTLIPDFGVKAAYGHDPDGNVVELQEILPQSGLPELQAWRPEI